MNDIESQHVSELRETLQLDPELSDLAASLGDTRRSVTELWGRSNLPNYTDHSHRHSRRVAARAHEIATKLPLTKKLSLGVMERYLLEMAAWVHDIGMQWEGEGGKYRDEPDEIRERHALSSRHAVLGAIAIVPGVEAGRIALGVSEVDRQAVLTAIAMLAHSHGTKSFLHASSEIAEKIPRISTYRVRGEVLAAILLMADELDLDSRRVPKSSQVMRMSALSHAHWLKHECVHDVHLDVVKGDKGEKLIHITIEMTSFSNLTSGDMAEIADWIRNKLVDQIGLTEQALAVGTQNRLRFDNRITVNMAVEGATPNPRATPEVMAIIRADNARALLANHDKCVEECETILNSGDSLVLVGVDRGADVPYQGREEVFALVSANWVRTGAPVITAAAEEASTDVASDVLESWGRQRGLELTSEEHEFTRRETALAALVSAGTPGARIGLTLPGLHLLEEDARSWLLYSAFPQLMEGGAYQIFLSTTAIAELDGLGQGWRVRDVGKADEEAVASHFRRSTAAALNHLASFMPTYDQAFSARKGVLQ